MKVYLMHHFICLKTKMTELSVGCFHIDFFPRQMKETYFKVLNNVQVVNNYIKQFKMIVSFFGNELSVI